MKETWHDLLTTDTIYRQSPTSTRPQNNWTRVFDPSLSDVIRPQNTLLCHGNTTFPWRVERNLESSYAGNRTLCFGNSCLFILSCAIAKFIRPPEALCTRSTAFTRVNVRGFHAPFAFHWCKMAAFCPWTSIEVNRDYITQMSSECGRTEILFYFITVKALEEPNDVDVIAHAGYD